jgi:hypothetical protein
MRLYSLGYLDTAYLGLRPWTRLSVVHMLELSAAKMEAAKDSPGLEEARGIYDSLWHELRTDAEAPGVGKRARVQLESVSTTMRGISGTPLRDSFHLGQTIVNDYGRPYQEGFNNYNGFSAYATAGHFSIYYRGESQYSPSGPGYSVGVAEQLSQLDSIAYSPKVSTIPVGPISETVNARITEAYFSAHLLGTEFSLGKSDEWMGVARGASFAYSNNAENIYSLRINNQEPFRIPYLARVTGPWRYDFMVGSLKGHIYPNEPWVHAEKISIKPTRDLEIGFERTVIWGGKGHVPITLHTFLRSFFSFDDVGAAKKQSSADPGARFTEFDIAYRLPYLRNHLMFYVDSEAHDDVLPASAPRRADIRPGLVLSHMPVLPHLELRTEAIMTDQSVSPSFRGMFSYIENQQPQGYTNKGQIFGDPTGRENKGGAFWATWHLSGNEYLEVNTRFAKAAKDFIPGAVNLTKFVEGGTTLVDVNASVVKRFHKNFELNGWVSYEQYLIPLLSKSRQNVTTTNFQFTWYPERGKSY